MAETLSEACKSPVNEYPGSSGVSLVNGRLLGIDEAVRLLSSISDGEGVVQGDDLVVAKVSSSVCEGIVDSVVTGEGSVLAEVRDRIALKERRRTPLLSQVWDLIDFHEDELREDLRRLGDDWERLDADRGDDPVYVRGEVEVEEDVFFDSTDGAIALDEGVCVEAFSRLEGPCWIGRDTSLHSATVRSGSSVGPVCRVGGEVEVSVLEGFSNMAHSTYLGHSYVGEWVNLGAFTVTSDLKNTYGEVRVGSGRRRRSSGRTKLGGFLADHSKTSVSTSVFAGARIGVSSHLYGVVAGDVPSFTIWPQSLGGDPVELELDSAVETMERMFSRRGREASPADRELLRHVHDLTGHERSEAEVREGRLQLF